MQVIRLGFGPDYVDYQRAWDLQRELHAKVVTGEEPDTALLLEHAAVYTAGKRTEAHERPLDGTPRNGAFWRPKKTHWPSIDVVTSAS